MDALKHFIEKGAALGYRPHPLIDLDFIRVKYKFKSNIEAYINLLNKNSVVEFTTKWFSRSFYRNENKDLINMDFVEDHFLTHGFRERRFPSEHFKVIDNEEFSRLGLNISEVIDKYEWELGRISG